MSLLAILSQLGFRVWFRYEKYREEFVKDDVILAVDETPVGTFVEIEGSEGGRRAPALRRSAGSRPTTSSTRIGGCSSRHCAQRGIAAGDMLFDRV